MRFPKGDPQDDRRLIDRILRGDRAAQEEFVHRFGGLIYAILRANGLSAEEKEDLFQQVFLRLWDQDHRRLRQWRGGGGGKFSSFLGILVARLVYDHKRCLSRRPPLAGQGTTRDRDRLPPDLPAPGPDPVTALCHHQQKAAIESALRQLSARDAELITLKHFREQSHREISNRLGMTPNHVKVALSRAEDRLRKGLYRSYPDLFATNARGIL